MYGMVTSTLLAPEEADVNAPMSTLWLWLDDVEELNEGMSVL